MNNTPNILRTLSEIKYSLENIKEDYTKRNISKEKAIALLNELRDRCGDLFSLTNDTSTRDKVHSVLLTVNQFKWNIIDFSIR